MKHLSNTWSSTTPNCSLYLMMDLMITNDCLHVSTSDGGANMAEYGPRHTSAWLKNRFEAL
jgi:hypothetical protein